MTFPTIADTNTSFEITNVTSHTVNLPPNISSGDLLLVFFCVDGNPSITFPNEGTDWISILDLNNAGFNRCKIAYRKADGGEGASIEVATDGAQMSSHVSYRITGHADPSTQAPEASTGATGSSNSPNPDSLDPTGGAKDFLWIAVAGYNDGRTTVTGYPTNYTLSNLNGRANDAEGVGTGVGGYNNNTTIEDPGTFTLSASERWVACTVAVHPLILTDASEQNSANFQVQRSDSKQNSANVTIQQADSKQLSANLLVVLPGSKQLSANFAIQKSDSAELSANFQVQSADSAEVSANATIQKSASAQLSANFQVQKSSSKELSSNFTSAPQFRGQLATSHEFQRTVVKNPRGLSRLYAVIETTTGLSLFRSTDGTPWTFIQDLSSTQDMRVDILPINTGSQFEMLVAYGPDASNGNVYYRRLQVGDAVEDPTVGSESSVTPSGRRPAIIRDRNGRVHVFYNDISGNDGRVNAKGSSETSLVDSPTWSSAQIVLTWSGSSGREVWGQEVVDFSSGDILGVIGFGRRDDGVNNTFEYRARDIVSFNGTTYSLGTETTFESVADPSGPPSIDAGMFSIVVDNQRYVHWLRKWRDSGGLIEDLTSRKSSSASTVESFATYQTVDSNTDIRSLSLVIEQGKTAIRAIYSRG